MVIKNYERTHSFGPQVAFAMAVAALGLLSLVIVDPGQWNRPKIQRAEVARSTTTGNAAQSVGATVMPTAPKVGD